MSAILSAIGLILFAIGAFGLYSGLYSGDNAAGELAARVREALSSAFAEPKTALVIAGAAAAVIGIVLVFAGAVRARREKKSRAQISIRVMTVLAMLLAMTVMLDRLPGLSIKTAGWKIGFSFVPPMLAAMLYGPPEAALVYGLSDLIGATLFPFGPYHPGFTVVAALMGFVMGLFLNKKPFAFVKGSFEWKKLRFFPNHLMPVLINAIALGLFVNTVWVSQLYGSKTYWGWFAYRLVEYAILVPVQLILIPALLKLCETLKKAGLAGRDRRRGASDERLREISRSESILGLERVTELLSLMGRPQNAVPVVHVAGTNGKGSFTAMLASVLREAGLKVGSFTSPAITGVTDSIRINGEPVSDSELDAAFKRIADISSAMKERPTEFEVLTAAAYGIFSDEKCDIAIVECGLGGAGDATNVVDKPLLAVITNVQLDHTDRLGGTTAEIAAKKAGIIKRGRPVLWGGDDPEAEAVVKAAAARQGASVIKTDRTRLSVISESIDGTEIGFSGFGRLRLSLIGAYQPENAANVLTAVEALRKEGLDIPDAAVRAGLSETSWPARFELIRKDPPVIFDGAHNPAGVSLAAESIKRIFPGTKAVLLVGVMADKDHAKYPGLLAPVCDKAFCVKPSNPRSLAADALADELRSGGVEAEGFDELSEGVAAAYSYAKEKGLPLVAMGTLYMYGQVIAALDAVQ
ncbi:MAG: folate family ECF transporter S component [Clostridia bacterium]|nr:folate family ECF transporter S component [Clostridia bacterium]